MEYCTKLLLSICAFPYNLSEPPALTSSNIQFRFFTTSICFFKIRSFLSEVLNMNIMIRPISITQNLYLFLYKKIWWLINLGEIKGRVFKNMVNLCLILRCHYLKFSTASVCYFWFSLNNPLRINTSPIFINLLPQALAALTLLAGLAHYTM